MEWIEEVDRELNKHIDNILLRQWQKMRAQLVAIGEVKNISLTKNSAWRTEEVDKDIGIFLIKKWKKWKFIAKSYKTPYSNSQIFVAN